MDFLDQATSDVEVRLDRAHQNRQVNLCYILALRLQVMEGVRGLMYQYAKQMADTLDYFLEHITESVVMDDQELDELLDELEEEYGESITESES